MAGTLAEKWESGNSHRGEQAAFHWREFLERHVLPLLYRRTKVADGPVETFSREQDFWERSSSLALSGVRLNDFRITDWFPRAPGVYWSNHGRRARMMALDRSYATDDPELGRIYHPHKKTSLVEDGGIGTIRLRPRRLDGEDYRLATALTGSQCAGGIPIALPNQLIREQKVQWGESYAISGQVRFLQDLELKFVAGSVHHASPILVFVDDISPVSEKRRRTP